MKANLHAARIAPKKANLIATMIRGMSVPDAVEALRRTDKKAARLIEKLLRSAIANASHNDRQDPQMMVVKTIVVNQGQALHRGVPMARGRVRPMRKFLSHISMSLGFAGDSASDGKSPKSPKSPTSPKKPTNTVGHASQKPKNAVQRKRTNTKKSTGAPASSSDSSASSDSSVSSS